MLLWKGREWTDEEFERFRRSEGVSKEPREGGTGEGGAESRPGEGNVEGSPRFMGRVERPRGEIEPCKVICDSFLARTGWSPGPSSLLLPALTALIISSSAS